MFLLPPRLNQAACTLLTSCSKLGGILGGGTNNPNGYPAPSSQTSSVEGTVYRVNTSNERIDLTLNNSSQSSQNATIYYNSQTRVLYQNQTYNPTYLQSGDRVLYQNRNYAPTDLERGDQVEVLAYNNGNGRFLADTVTVTRNVRQ